MIPAFFMKISLINYSYPPEIPGQSRTTGLCEHILVVAASLEENYNTRYYRCSEYCQPDKDL